MKSRKQEIESSINILRHELNGITDKENEIENKKFIGRFFKTRNNFSCPKKPNDYWWLYLKVVEIKDGSLSVLIFQVDKDGRIEVEPDRFYMARSFDRYTEIKELEYIKAWNIMINKLDAL